MAIKQEFTKEELKALYQLVQSYEEGLVKNPQEDWELDYHDKALIDRKPLNGVLKKIESMLPKEKKEEIKKELLRRKYSTFNSSVDESVYQKIEQSFNSLKTVELGYFNMDSAEVTKRLVDIYYKSARYTIGYCHLRKNIRKFRTSRIVSAKQTNQSYKIPENFNKNNY